MPSCQEKGGVSEARPCSGWAGGAALGLGRVEIAVGQTAEVTSDGAFLFSSPSQESRAPTPTPQCHRDCGCGGTPGFR